MLTFYHNEATAFHSFLWTDLPFSHGKVYQLKSAVFLVSMLKINKLECYIVNIV